MSKNKRIEIVFNANPNFIVGGLLISNFLIRLFIYFNTNLFSFSDYAIYLNGIERIAGGEKQYLLIGNFLFAISYLGYFAKNILGSLDYFFVYNCLLGTLTSLLIYFMVVKITGVPLAGIITIIIHTLYTEFIVFSSVFYTPVQMIFLLSLFLLFIYLYLDSNRRFKTVIFLFLTILVFLMTFIFKPELKYLTWFLLFPGLFFLKSNKSFAKKILSLSFLLLTSYYLLSYSNLITHPKDNVISNAFVFFGHTDYGGDGGEGSFVYPDNKARYESALAEYCKSNNIRRPTTQNYNEFHREEIKKFITTHPCKWVSLQFTKFFRTFGVVPETTSFKILYTGLFKGNLWLTSIVVVAPVALIILLFIMFFNLSALKQLLGHQVSSRLMPHASRPPSDNRGFLSVYLLLFVYYIIATIFYGQYQERYRLPMMVVFIIPTLGFFIASFNKDQFFKRSTLTIKSVVIVLFLAIWTFQTKKAIGNKQRFENAIESLEIKSKK